MAETQSCAVPPPLARSILEYIQTNHGLQDYTSCASDFQNVALQTNPYGRVAASLNFKESTLVVTLWRDSRSTGGIKYLVDLEYGDPGFVSKLDMVIRRAKEGFKD